MLIVLSFNDTSVGQVSAKCRPSIGEVTVTWKAMSADTHDDRHSVDTRRHTPSGDRVSTATSTDIAVDITYSKHDPTNLWRIYKQGKQQKAFQFSCENSQQSRN